MFPNLENFNLRIYLPPDEEGYTGRECPQSNCLKYFKIKYGTGLKGENLLCTCPYCGYKDSHDRFNTKDQLNYAFSEAVPKINDAIEKDFNKLKIRYESSKLFPITYYKEKKLETNIVCNNCTLHFSVYGVFGFCPDCGVHNSLQILDKNLNIVKKLIQLTETITDEELKKNIIEDALENCVSSFDGFGRESAKIRSHLSSNPVKAKKLSFQNLNKIADDLKEVYNIDLRSCISKDEWDRCKLGFMRRHLIAHCSGVVDQKYLNETNDNTYQLGRKVNIEAKEVEELTVIIQHLAQELFNRLPPI